ncbi:MAG: GNAT family N-acetyltransferase [Alphaproteobacteria bacterium]
MFGFLKPRARRATGPRLDGERTYLRPPRGADWRAWAALRETSRAFLAPWEPIWPPYALTRRAYRRRLRGHAAESRAGLGFAFFVFQQSDGTLLGGVTLTDIRRGVAQSCDLGYWIGRPYARQGYMSEAIRLVLRFAFADLGLHRVNAACLPSNVASQGLLRKMGFDQEGYARDYLRIDGRWQDHLLFAALPGNAAEPAVSVRAAE